MLLRIDTHIPTYPANTEHSAPSTNDSVIHDASCSELPTGSNSRWLRTTPYPRNNTAANTTASSRMVRFCRRRNASAPSLIASEIRRIAGLPVENFSTHRAR